MASVGEGPKGLAAAPTALFELNAAAEHAKRAVQKKERQSAKLITAGSAVVQIFGRGPYTIAWRETADGPRKRAMRSDFAKAKKFAQDKATVIANGEAWRHKIGQNDFAAYQRAVQLLLPTGESIEVAAGNYAQFRAVLVETKMLAADAFKILRAQASRAKIVHKTCPEIFKEFIAAKKAGTFGNRHCGSKWLNTLEGQLETFAEYFQKPFNDVTTQEMETWINELPVKSGRTRKGYRDAISGMVTFAIAKQYLDPNWKEFERVPVPRCGRPMKPICTPDQLVKMLSAAKPNMIPFIVLQAFGGVRHEELNPEDAKKTPLDWTAIKSKVIRIPRETSKTDTERFIRMPDNLIAWLAQYRQPNGPIVTLAETGNALTRIKRKAGVPAGKNETRNFLRKSWETYSSALKAIEDVVGESGHSQAISKKHYVAETYREEADRWFAIKPTTADILQLNFALA